MENKVCYVVTVSERFPKNSYSAGLETDFKELILTGNKIHTLRSNALLWGKRLDKIAHNEAHLSLRTWAGKPYHTPQKEFTRFTQSFDGAGVEFIEATKDGFFALCGKRIDESDLAWNDGLSIENFRDYFKDLPCYAAKNVAETVTLACVHFSDFRYAG